MIFTSALRCARLIRRYKRFLADVELEDGSLLTIYCPNTGAMTRCADPGARVWYSASTNAKRKYPHTFELVEVAGGALACIHSARANALVAEAQAAGDIPELAGYPAVRPEARFGEERSRVDFLLQGHATAADCYVEVKSVTLGMEQGLGLFPDAVSARGSRHLRELMRVRASGQRAVLLFCVLHTGIERVAAAADIDPVYAATLAEAHKAGVDILAYGADISPQGMQLTHKLPVVGLV